MIKVHCSGTVKLTIDLEVIYDVTSGVLSNRQQYYLPIYIGTKSPNGI
ncbi:MAG: hypothetical protein R3E90_09520 [Marinicella sp.]|nr:hypothetical protein [Xanthomonadales bacterium]